MFTFSPPRPNGLRLKDLVDKAVVALYTGSIFTPDEYAEVDPVTGQKPLAERFQIRFLVIESNGSVSDGDSLIHSKVVGNQVKSHKTPAGANEGLLGLVTYTADAGTGKSEYRIVPLSADAEAAATLKFQVYIAKA